MIELLVRRWHRLQQRAHPPVTPIAPVSLRDPDPTATRVLDTRPRVAAILHQNIVPFWLPGCLDPEHGGYLLHHDPAGRWLGPAPRHTVAQARTCWFFSRLARSGGGSAALEAAATGYRFLRDHCWDPTGGGFAWAVSHDGTQVTDPRKLLMAQTFGLYAVAEFGAATGDPEVAGFACQVAELLEQRFHDPAWGGYHQGFDAGGKPILPPRKTLNEHMHVLEALSAASRLVGPPGLRDRLQELLQIHTSTVVRKTRGACTDLYDERWTPLLAEDRGAVSYGHDIESVWLVADGCAAVGLPVALVADWVRVACAVTLRWGWDRAGGGVYFAGPLDGPPWDRRKVEWVQGEVAAGALFAYRLTGDPELAELYLSTLDWISRRQLDEAGGEWHAVIEEDGRVSGDKAGLWKSPYHNGRGMLMCLDLLEPGPLRLGPDSLIHLPGL